METLVCPECQTESAHVASATGALHFEPSALLCEVCGHDFKQGQCFRLAAGAGREKKTGRGLLSVCVSKGLRAATVANRRLRLSGPGDGLALTTRGTSLGSYHVKEPHCGKGG